MKKILAIAIGIVFIGAYAHAAASTSSGGSITLNAGGGSNPPTVTLSSNVSAAYNAANSGTNYSAITVHNKGNREYGGASQMGKIVYKTVSVGTSAAGTDLSTGDSTDFDSTWTEVGK